MEPFIRQSYVRNFNADELQTVLDFYRSPVGHAFLTGMLHAKQDTALLQNLTALERTVEQGLSAAQLNALHEFQRSTTGQQIWQKMQHVQSEIINTIDDRASSIFE